MYEHQEQAHKAAIEAKESMPSPELWYIEVWRDFGWHWSLKNDDIIITETRDSYACSISCKWDGKGKTPYDAALDAMGAFEFEFSCLQSKHKQLLPVIESLREKFKQDLMG